MPYCQKCGNELPEGAKYCNVCGSAVLTATAPTEIKALVSGGVKLAFWWERFVAWLIDAVIIGVVVGILGLFSLFAGLTWWSGWPIWLPFFNFNLTGILYFLYWTLMDGVYGQSIGKMIMRIKVTDLNGEKPQIGNAVIESLGKAFLLPLDCLLGWILYPNRRQRIFNYISNTVVTRET